MSLKSEILDLRRRAYKAEIEFSTKRKIDRILSFPKDKALSKLKQFSERVRCNSVSYRTRRNNFNLIKWTYYNEWKGEKCGLCKTNQIENLHHMVLLKNGGSNEKLNLIGLCFSCHAEIHPWLKAKQSTDPVKKRNAVG